jgi:hypothetical protein
MGIIPDMLRLRLVLDVVKHMAEILKELRGIAISI